MGSCRRVAYRGVAHILTEVSAISPAGSGSPPALVTVLTIDRAIPAGFKRNRRPLAAIGTRNARSLDFAGLVFAGCSLFILLRVAARGATFRYRIPARLEELLIFVGKRKFLAAVSTGLEQISNHEILSSTL